MINTVGTLKQNSLKVIKKDLGKKLGDKVWINGKWSTVRYTQYSIKLMNHEN